MINKCNFILLIALSLCITPNCTEAANILAFLPSCSPSHLIIEMAVVKAMAERNHNVTVVSVLPLKPDSPDSNMTYVHLNSGSVDVTVAINATKQKGFGVIRQWLNFKNVMSNNLAKILDDPIMQELMYNTGNKFDLMLYGYFYTDFFFGIAEHFDCPVALLWPNMPFEPIFTLIGNPLEISYTTVSLLNIDHTNTGFLFRLKNMMALIVEALVARMHNGVVEQIYEKHFPSNKYGSLEKAKERVSMVLFSHHFSEKPVRPLVPALIEIGGIHLNEQPKPLPQDIETFVTSAEHGVIFFSMGTNIKSHHMQEQAFNKIYNVLSKLPQKILWKIGDESEVLGNATNILYRKWLPQGDILGHPNVKLFFGHGGKGGITEAKFYGVPMVGLPIFFDQPMNVQEIVDKGYGLGISHNKPLTEAIIYVTVKEVLENPTYSNTVKRFSALYRDRPINIKENAVYWLEYLIRYKGAPHLQSPLKTMSFVESLNLDIIALVLALLYILVKLVKLSSRVIIKLCWRLLSRKTKKD